MNVMLNKPSIQDLQSIEEESATKSGVKSKVGMNNKASKNL